MTENFSNTYQTTLSAAISSTSATTLTVTSATGAPSVNFRIKIDSELMLVTGVSSLTFTVTRGIEGTTAATHSNGATVTHVLTAGGLSQAISDITASSRSARAYHNTTQSVNTSYSALAFNSETYDTNNFHDTSTNNSRMTIPMDGVYVLSAACSTASGNLSSYFRLNGSSVLIYGNLGQAGATSAYLIRKFTQGDYIDFMVKSSTTSTIDADEPCFFAISAASGTALADAGVGVRAKTTGTVNGTGATLSIPFAAEDFDTNAFHDNSTNNERLTVPSGKGGKYVIGYDGTWSSGEIGAETVISIRLNGSTDIGGWSGPVNSSFVNKGASGVTVYDMVAGDYVELRFLANSGDNLGSCRFWMMRINDAAMRSEIQEATLSGDVTMTTADTFYDGPTITPSAGVYDVWGRVCIQAVATNQQYIVGRLIANGGTVIDETETQTAMVNTSKALVYLAARVTADGTNPILIRATASNASLVMKRDPTDDSSSIHRATLLRITRVS